MSDFQLLGVFVDGVKVCVCDCWLMCLQDVWEISGAWNITTNKRTIQHKCRGGRCENLEAYLSEKANKILIYSPDTDVYNIGLRKHIISHVECIVQINLPHPSEQRFVSLNNLKTALDNDPDLASINREGLLNTLQMLFIVSGCDYTSYFAGIGNTASLNTFYHYSDFITGNTQEGSLCDNSSEREIKRGFLSFMRLIGTLF